MRGFIALFCILSAFTAWGADFEPWAHVLLRLEHTVSTETARVGDHVHLRTVSPIATVPSGSYARGVITRVKRAGRIRGRAELEISLVSFTLPSGDVLPVAARTASIEPPRRGHGPLPSFGAARAAAGLPVAGLLVGGITGGETGARIGVGVGLGALILTPFLARGNDVELRQGSAIDVVFESTVPSE